MKRGPLAPWLVGCFLVSGFCGLVYQIVWLRLAMAAFGVNTPVVSVVVSAFMGGLALGNWAGGSLARGKRLEDARQPLRLYALAECTVATSSFVIGDALLQGRRALAASGFADWGSAGYYGGVLLVVSLVLLPFCFAMGATFPLALWALRADDAAGEQRGFSRLYGPNVLGATAGSLVAAFLLIELLGLHGSLAVAATLNSALAVCALLLSLRKTAVAREGSAGPVPATAPSTPTLRGPWTPVVLFATGFVSMAMEIVWSRQYSFYLGNIVYAFALIVAVYLAATYAGTLLCRARPAGSAWRGPTLLAASALLALLPVVATDPRLPAAATLFGVVFRVVLGIAPFCATLGFLTPDLIDRFSGGEPRRAGRVYAVNTLGCIAGPLAASFLLLPRLPERWTLACLVLPLAALALFSPRQLGEAGGRTRGTLLLGWGAALVAVVAGIFGRDSAATDAAAIVLRDHTATVAAGGLGKGRFLSVNGVGMTSLTPITKLMVHAPLALHEPGATDALIICFGMGTSFRSAASWGIDVTAVELVPSVPRLFGFYHADGPALLRRPNARVVIDDGRRFLEWTSRTYDVIVVDPPPPVEAAGSSLLYSTEFYGVAARRLRPGGIMQQWMPGGADSFTRLSFIHAFVASFPHVRMFRSIEGWGLHLLGSDSPIAALDASQLAARLPKDAAADLVEWYPGATPEGVFAAFLKQERNEERTMEVARAVPALRDDRPYNEYFFLRHLRQHAAEQRTSSTR